MNSIILTEYANKLPEEVKDLLLGFSSPENLGLLAALMERGKMSFNEMKQEFKLSSSSLTNRLNVLQNGNLVKNFYEKTDGRGFSYYDVTDVFQQIFGSVYEILYSPTSTEKTELSSAVDKMSQFTNAYVGKGDVLGALGQHDDAIRCFDEAIKLSPDFANHEPSQLLHHFAFANNSIATTKDIRSGNISENPITYDRRRYMSTRKQIQNLI